jgi:hypothetical protein
MRTTYTQTPSKARVNGRENARATTSSFFTKKAFLSKLALFLAVFTLSFGAVFSAVPTTVEAATPSVSFASNGANSVQISVYGDPNQAVNLYYYNIGTTLINSVGSIGTTNSSGYFSNTISGTAYNIPSGASVYVVVSGQQSPTMTWPSVSGGSVYLSQSSLVMNQGQSTTVSISGGNGANYYVNSNSNSSTVGATISGNILTLNAIGTGYVTINVCSIGTSTTCAPLAVTVNSTWGGNSGSIYLSPSSITVAPGQSQTVSINSYNNTYNGYNYGNNYYIANNPGSQYFSASISGNSVIVYGNNPGSATLNICSQYSGSSCASLYVVVSSTYYNGYNGYNYNNNGYNGFNYTSPTSYTYPNSYTYPVSYTYPSTSYTYPTNTYVSNGSTNTGRSVSGVFLSQVPSTGISFGLKMTLFTLGLALWSLFVAYMITRRGGVAIASRVANSNSASSTTSKTEAFKLSNMKKKGIL